MTRRRRDMAGVVLVAVLGVANVWHLAFGYLPHREYDMTALVATELGDFLVSHPAVRSVYFCGGDGMDWGANASLPFRLPDIEHKDVAPDWRDDPEPLPPAAAIVTVRECSELRNRLLSRTDLRGQQLLYVSGLSGVDAARMYADTGGRGYFRWDTSPGNVQYAEGEIEVFTLFRATGH